MYSDDWYHKKVYVEECRFAGRAVCVIKDKQNTEHNNKNQTELLLTVSDYEREAYHRLNNMTRDYYFGGSGEEVTLRSNREAFYNYKFRPRFLGKDVSQRNLSVSLMNGSPPVSFPVGICPTALHKLAHPLGEVATARAAAREGVVYIMSMSSSTSIEEVAAAAPSAIKWLQLHMYKTKKFFPNLIKRAEAAGFQAIVLTIDNPVHGKRVRDLRNGFCFPTTFLWPTLFPSRNQMRYVF